MALLSLFLQMFIVLGMYNFVVQLGWVSMLYTLFQKKEEDLVHNGMHVLDLQFMQM